MDGSNGRKVIKINKGIAMTMQNIIDLGLFIMLIPIPLITFIYGIVLGIKYEKKNLTNKVCEWLYDNWFNYGQRNKIINALRKVMEE